MKFDEAKMRKCMRVGHDWALKDYKTFMSKVCLRCGAEQFFLPKEEDRNDI